MSRIDVRLAHLITRRDLGYITTEEYERLALELLEEGKDGGA